METIVSITLPFFALVLLGHAAGSARLLPESAIPGLNAYVLFFALPCLLFRFGSSMPIGRLLDPVLIGLYALAALLIVALTVTMTLQRAARPRPGVDLRNAAFGALVAAFPNSGFMGVPLIVALQGPAAAGPVIGTLLVDLFLTCTLCLALAHGSDPRHGSGAGKTAFLALRGAASNPQPWAIALGAAVAATHTTLPTPLGHIVGMLADSATPVALFTIGAVLWRSRLHSHRRTPLRLTLPVALIKLFVHPALVAGLGLLARFGGLPVPTFGLTVLVLAAALPSASNVSLLAERHGAENGRIARIIMASTVLAFGSFTLLAWLLDPARA